MILSVPLPVYILGILNNVWAIIAVMAILVAFDPIKLINSILFPNRANNDLNLSNIALHGKLSNNSKNNKSKEGGINKYLYVPKSHFTHFYVFGTLCTSLFFVLHIIVMFTSTDGNNYCIFPLSLFLFQCIRRLG